MTTKNRIQPLPCPICGESVSTETCEPDGEVLVMCCRINTFGSSRDEAVTNWNAGFPVVIEGTKPEVLQVHDALIDEYNTQSCQGTQYERIRVLIAAAEEKLLQLSD